MKQKESCGKFRADGCAPLTGSCPKANTVCKKQREALMRKRIQACLRSLDLEGDSGDEGVVAYYGCCVKSVGQYDLCVSYSGRLLRVSVRMDVKQLSSGVEDMSWKVDELNSKVPVLKFVCIGRNVECRLEVESAWAECLDDKGLRHMFLLPIAAMDMACEVLR